MDDLISRQDDRGVSLKSVKHILYDVCLHEDNRALFSKLLDRVNKLRDWEEYLTIKQEPCEDAISRQDAIKAINEKAKRIKNEDTLNGLAGAVGILFDLPSVNPQPKTGHWVGIDEKPHEDYECDKCGYVVSTFTENIEPHTEYKYCPNCGAKMAESEDKE